MHRAEVKNAPLLAGWAIGAAAGLVAFGVSLVAIGLGANASAAIGGVVFLVIGLILGLPSSPRRAPAMAPGAAPDTGPVRIAMPAAAPAPAAPASLMPAPVAARRPEALSGPRGGKADDLKVIEGIGPKLEELCNSLGFYHIDQIAGWSAEEIGWVDANLAGFKGRVTRDKWVAQARIIVTEGMESFLRRAKTNDY